MLALETLSADATAVVYVFAFVALLCSAVLCATARNSVGALLAGGLALFVFVAAYNALAAT